MNGRIAPKFMLAADQPLDMPTEAEAALEQDKLFFLDPVNKNKLRLFRPLIPGEELPYKMPPEDTVVMVTRTRRLFSVFEIPTLVIEDDAQDKVGKKKKHLIFPVSELNANLHAKRLALPVEDVKLIDKEQRRVDELRRQAARRVEKETVRQSRIANTKVLHEK